MNPRVILLFTRDRTLDQLVAKALFETGTKILAVRNVGEALQILCQKGCELDFAVMDFDDSSHGMTLLSAVHTFREKLPIVVTTSSDSAQTRAIAYVNGATLCLTKPALPSDIANAFGKLYEMDTKLAIA